MATTERRAYIEGAPEPLPEGERILWQGKPERAALARHAFHTRGLTLYFTAVIGLWAVNTRAVLDREAFLNMLLMQVALAAVAVVIAHVLAFACARTTTYAITERRVVMRIGIVLPMTLNLPYRFIHGASVRGFRDGTGQIALQLAPSERLAWLVLWPHVRPWRIARPEPVLRGLRDPDAVGMILREAAERVPVDEAAPAGAGGDPAATATAARRERVAPNRVVLT